MPAWLIGQTLIGGLLLGGLYALVAGGLTLIFGVVRVLNFAHGELTMLAMFGTYGLAVWFGLHPYLSLLIMVPLGFGVGQLMYLGLLRRVFDGPEGLRPVLLTAGVGLTLQNGALGLFGSTPRVLVWPFAADTLRLGAMTVDIPRLVAFGGSCLVAGVFYWLLGHTDLGRAVRAVAEDPEAAMTVGLDVRRIMGWAFGLGVACVAVAGPLLAVIFPFTPFFGNLFMLSAFAVVLLGGLGSFPGALLGGLILGVADAFGAVLLPGTLAPLLGYALLTLILIWRPDGLLGG